MKRTVVKVLPAYFFILLLSLVIVDGCKQKALSGQELENKLKETMLDHLHKTMKVGTQVDIRELTYYPDKERQMYICQFSVHVHTPTTDTTGIMRAFISNDFEKVERTE
jgi:hypothetical protein